MNKFNSIFTPVKPEGLSDNFFKIINNDWMLIAAGIKDDFNMMTASWGTTGILWHKPVAFCFIRPQRYTLQFALKYDYFTLSFFDEQHHEILNYCGTHSGRNIDKVKETGLTPIETYRGNITFEQARLILECKKLYSDILKPECFIIDEVSQKNYPKKDFHRFFIGEIEYCYMKR